MSPQEQREPRQDTDLTPLTERYELVAEVRGRENGRTFIAKRREDGLDVLIFLLRASRETGDRDDLSTSDSKSLTLFAADTKLLAGLKHRNMLPIVDSQWVGKHSFAVITERTNAPTLDELIERSEPMPSSRIAEILRGVNGLLEWARTQTVTHRGVRPDTLFVEPGTDRVRIAFVMRPLPVSGAIEPQADARTIAELAYTMFSRGDEPPENENAQQQKNGEPSALAAARPDLPTRIVEETESILRSSDTPDTPTDVLAYIALVAMADNLKVVEEDTMRARAELAEEQRASREQIENDRTAFERARDEETRKFAEEREQLQRQLSEEREKMQAALNKERKELQETLARERNELQRTLSGEQERLATERDELQRAIEKERKQLKEARAELERAIAKEREEIENERQILERIGGEAVRYKEETQRQIRELEERRATLAKESKDARERERSARLQAERAAEITAAELSEAATSEPVELPLTTFEETELAEPVLPNVASDTAEAQVTRTPVVDAPHEPVASESSPSNEPPLEYVDQNRQKRMRNTVAVAGGVVAVTIAAALFAMNHASSGTPSSTAKRTATHTVVDSAAGGVALRGAPAAPTQYASVVPLPAATDSITAALAKEWKPKPKPRPKPKPVFVDTSALLDSTRAPESVTPSRPTPTPTRAPTRSATPAPMRVNLDSLLKRPAVIRDSIARSEAVRPRPDSAIKPPD